MKLQIAAAGRIRSGPERVLIDDYLERVRLAGRAIGFTGAGEIEIDPKKSAGRGGVDEALLAVVPAGGVVIAMDERGAALKSADFAKKLGAWRDEGRPAAVFLLGEADGLAEATRKRADLMLAFGAWTWPHRLARVMLAEQLYRGVSILAGAPYHRE